MLRPSPFSLAICLRCQFRYSQPQLQLLAQRSLGLNKPTTAFFTSTPLCRDTTSPPRELIVLERPGPWRPPLNRPRKPQALDDTNLVSGTNELLTFEHKLDNILDATQMEISLYQPSLLRMSRERYQQISQELNNAFLRAQLYDYLTEWARRKPAKGAVVRKATTKRGILDQILRKIWGVEVTDEIAEREDVLINKEIKSCRKEIFFMIGEDGRVLRGWAQEFSTRITVNVQTSLMQLRGSLANIERLECAMQNMLKRIITGDIDLSWTSGRWAFNEDYVTPIAKLTNTFIEKINDSTIRVVALGPERHAIDDVRRLLFTSFDMQFRSTCSLLYSASCKHESSKGSLYPFTEDPSLPWMFRGRDWARWRYVKSKSKAAQEQGPGPDEQGLSTIKTRGEQSLKGLEEVRKILDESANTETIETEAGQQPPAEYQAILGCLLHDSESSTMQQSPQTIEEFIKDERPRVLSNEFPGISFIAQAPISRMDSSEAYKVDSPKLIDSNVIYSFSLRFAPSSWSNPESFENYPSLEMTFAIDPASGEVLKPKLAARHSESVADILMPGRHCDLRFLRRVDIPLGLDISRNELDAGGVTHEEMVRFMDESNLSPTGSGKLRSSPSIKVSIPPWMMQRFSGLRTTEVDYLFTGMEFKRELSFEWEGLRLQHSVIEGGTSGGRRTEVKLICKPIPKSQEKLEVEACRKALGTQGAVKQDLKMEAEEHGMVAQVVGMEVAEALTAQEIEMEEKTPAGGLGVAELKVHAETRVSEMQTFTGVSDSTFSSFVKSTMTLVKSLELRFSQSTKGGKGIQR